MSISTGSWRCSPRRIRLYILNAKKRRWNAELFGNAEKIGVTGVDEIQNFLIVQKQVGSEEICFTFQPTGGLIDIEILHSLTAEVV